MSAPEKWRQQFWVSGRSLKRLIATAELYVAPSAENILICGAGDYFPELAGADWVAGCAPYADSDDGLSDLSGLLEFLIDGSFYIESRAPRRELEAFMRGRTCASKS
jgi:hypothetical protein